MIAWRICKAKWAATAFSGLGAAENPGRWNTQGRKAVYCAESRSLAMLEILAHVGNKRHLRRAKFVAIPVTIPDALIATVPHLPRNWRAIPPSPATRKLGDRLLTATGHPALKVPSAIIPGEFCFVLAPDHPAFGSIAIGAPIPADFNDRIAR